MYLRIAPRYRAQAHRLADAMRRVIDHLVRVGAPKPTLRLQRMRMVPLPVGSSSDFQLRRNFRPLFFGWFGDSGHPSKWKPRECLSAFDLHGL